MKFFSQIHLFILVLSASCTGNPAAINSDTEDGENSAILLGDTVTEMAKGIWVIYQDKNGSYWFGSNGGGVYRYDAIVPGGMEKNFVQYTTKHGLCNNDVREIKEDASGNIYLNTSGGISKFDGTKFTTLTEEHLVDMSNQWRLDSNDLWFKGSKGPSRYDGNTLYSLELPKSPMEDTFYSNQPKMPWSPYDIYYLYKDRSGAMWFGTGNLGLCRYDGEHFDWMYESHLTNTGAGGSFGIRSILEDSKGQFWICNNQFRYKIESSTTGDREVGAVRYERERGIPGVMQQDGDWLYFMSALEDVQHNLWLCTYSEGIFMYTGKKAIRYPLQDSGTDITAYSIYLDHSGNLWVGTHEHGTYIFNGMSFEPFIP